MNIGESLAKRYNAIKEKNTPRPKNSTPKTKSKADLTETNITQPQLLELLDNVKQVDFGEISGIKEPKQKHHIVVIINQVLKLADKLNLGLCKNNDFIYLYNKTYWQEIDKQQLKTFLGEMATMMGYNPIESRYFDFRDKLLKQFLSDANFPNLVSDPSKVLINLLNGTFEISPTGSKLREHQKEDFLTYKLPFNYDPQAGRPEFEKYLNRVLPDLEIQNVLSEFLGYVFTRHLKLEKCLLLFGSGANGKSVPFEIINAMLGRQNISTFSLGNLKEEHNRALLINKLLNYGSEIRADIDPDLFKQLVSGEPVQARLKYGNTFMLENYAKLAFNCNILPKNIEHSEAYFRRFLIIPFDVTIPENERDPELATRIVNNELSGVLNWVINGLDRLLKEKGFTKSIQVTNAINRYRKESDVVQLFMEDKAYQPSINNWEYLKNLYNEFATFCKDNGNRQMCNNNFSSRLKILGYESKKSMYGLKVFIEKQPFNDDYDENDAPNK